MHIDKCYQPRIGKRGGADSNRQGRKIEREIVADQIKIMKYLLRRVDVAEYRAERETAGDGVGEGRARGEDFVHCCGNRAQRKRTARCGGQGFLLADGKPHQNQ